MTRPRCAALALAVAVFASYGCDGQKTEVSTVKNVNLKGTVAAGEKDNNANMKTSKAE